MVIFTKGQHGKSIYSGLAFNATLFRKSLHAIIKGGNGDILLAISRKGQIRGLLIAWHEALLWNHRPMATDLHFIAEQGGDMLLRAFRRWAHERGCCEIGMGTFSTENADRVETLFNRLGFETVGKTYRMELFG